MTAGDMRPEAEAIRIDLLRKAPTWKRLGVARRNPSASLAELRRLAAEAILGPEPASTAHGVARSTLDADISSREKMAAVMGPGGAFEGMEEAITEGKVRFPAFSAHSLPVAAEMIRTGRFAAMQVPFNFVDHQAADEVIPLARDKGMGMIAMKPLGGGLLEDARLCFRYLAQFPDVVPDPGIETADQMREIISCMAVKGPLTEEERGNIEALRSALGKAWCHRCDYCQPCPQGIPISVILVAESFIRRMPLEKMRTFVEAPFKTAEACTECRQCADRCPYNLDIPSLLKRHRSSWDGLLRTGVWSESAE